MVSRGNGEVLATPADRQLGFLWGAVSVSMVALSPLLPRLAPFLPGCLLRRLTGFPCLTCGSTRAALALGRLDPLGALAVNPLAALALSALVAGGLLALGCALGGRRVWQPPPRLSLRVRVVAIAALLANWCYLVWAGV